MSGMMSSHEIQDHLITVFGLLVLWGLILVMGCATTETFPVFRRTIAPGITEIKSLEIEWDERPGEGVSVCWYDGENQRCNMVERP